MFLLPFCAGPYRQRGYADSSFFEKPSPGTGATLLVECLAYAAIGRPVPAMTEGRDEDEWQQTPYRQVSSRGSIHFSLTTWGSAGLGDGFRRGHRPPCGKIGY